MWNLWIFENTSYKKPLNNWNTSKVKNMSYMFINSKFNWKCARLEKDLLDM